MKKSLILLAIVIGLMSFIKPGNNLAELRTTNKNSVVALQDNLECRYGQCQAIAKSTGYQCRHCVSNSGDSYCWQHR
jgi:hypothetical protein